MVKLTYKFINIFQLHRLSRGILDLLRPKLTDLDMSQLVMFIGIILVLDGLAKELRLPFLKMGIGALAS